MLLVQALVRAHGFVALVRRMGGQVQRSGGYPGLLPLRHQRGAMPGTGLSQPSANGRDGEYQAMPSSSPLALLPDCSAAAVGQRRERVVPATNGRRRMSGLRRYQSQHARLSNSQTRRTLAAR